MPPRLPPDDFRPVISKAVQDIQEALGWDKRRLAAEMGITVGALNQRRCGRQAWSVNRLSRIRTVTGIDPYVLAYCRYCDISKLPGRVPELLKELRAEWEAKLRLARNTQTLYPGGW